MQKSWSRSNTAKQCMLSFHPFIFCLAMDGIDKTMQTLMRTKIRMNRFRKLLLWMLFWEYLNLTVLNRSKTIKKWILRCISVSWWVSSRFNFNFLLEKWKNLRFQTICKTTTRKTKKATVLLVEKWLHGAGWNFLKKLRKVWKIRCLT